MPLAVRADQIMLSVMVDNCIMSLSDTMQCVLKPVEVRFGEKTQWVDVLGFERRPSPRNDEEWKLEQFQCLPTIARLARENQIRCCTYHELRHEGWRRPNSFPANPIGRLFRYVEFYDVDAAVERSYFFQGDMNDVLSNDKMIEFCQWLLRLNVDSHMDQVAHTGRFPEFLINNIRCVNRFRELCVGLSQKQMVDAFHLWTAETNGIPYFLTTDRKFINAMTESKKIDLETLPVSPSHLLDRVGVTDRDPFPHPDDGTIDIFGNPL